MIDLRPLQSIKILYERKRLWHRVKGRGVYEEYVRRGEE